MKVIANLLSLYSQNFNQTNIQFTDKYLTNSMLNNIVDANVTLYNVCSKRFTNSFNKSVLRVMKLQCYGLKYITAKNGIK